MAITLLLCGDVMTGRGIDQALPHPSHVRLYEPAVDDAAVYVELAEQAHGYIRRPVAYDYVWGDALTALEQVVPDATIVNLETSVTTNDEPCVGKRIHYRMNPANLPCLVAGRIDCCTLANNHVLDWGRAGLLETLDVLRGAGIHTVGAGRTLAEAAAPAILPVGQGRVLVFGMATHTSGVPSGWAARRDRPGVRYLADLSDAMLREVTDAVRSSKRPGDVVVVSIHWDGNWGFAVPNEHVRFAHGLVAAGVDVVHGHSSHHVRPIEVFRSKLILYGCGEFLDDYEGISGYEQFRDDLVLMYFPTIIAATGTIVDLRMVPMQIRNFKLQRAATADVRWLSDTINRESRRFGVHVDRREDCLQLRVSGVTPGAAPWSPEVQP
jgi:poly-gamma-glutamate synthesis protein (capsule biosynthesis protein)